ncbi:F-box protein Das1p [Monosporozyma unispora]|nr:F-box protein [Kazachstania unispora]
MDHINTDIIRGTLLNSTNTHNDNNNNNNNILNDSIFPINNLPDDILFEIIANLPQRDRLTCLLINKRWYNIAIKLLYRRIYLNDSNVVRSDFINIAINWTLIYIPSFLNEDESREIANIKLSKLISTLQTNINILESIQWIRINWDLDANLQKKVLNLLCSKGKSLQRLENVTDPSCNNIIADGYYSSKNLISFDMAPPNSLPELTVPENYIPNLIKYLNQRISTHLSHMTLFIDPLKLFNYLYPLKEKLTIIDLKLHWRREFYSPEYFKSNSSTPKYTSLTDVFDIRTLKTLTIISWNESLMSHEIDMIKEFKKFKFLEDLSLISIKQDRSVLMDLFNKLSNLKRLKMDFLEDYIPETTNPQIFLSILITCKKLQFIDIRFEGIDSPIIDMTGNKFTINQKCYCNKCNNTFNEVLRKKIFVFPIDYYLTDVQDIAAKDIFKMMRYLSLLPYSKACDSYPSVRTQPMNLDEFVKKMNNNLANYRQHKSQLLNSPRDGTESELNHTHENDTEIHNDEIITLDTMTAIQNTATNPNATNMEQLDALLSSRILNQRQDNKVDRLPHEPLTKMDIINLYHAMIHHFKQTYFTFLKGFPELRFLMLNDIPTIAIEENGERIFHPIFYHYDYTSNLVGWTKNLYSFKTFKGNVDQQNNDDAVTRRATFM